MCAMTRGGDALGPPVLHADHGGLPDWPASGSGERLARRVVHVPAFAAEVRFVHFDRAMKHRAILRQRRSEPMRQEPRGLLRDAEVAVQLHAGHALETGHHLKRGDDPVLIADLRAFHDRAGLDAEELRARLLSTPERHGRVLRASLDVHRSAAGTAHAIRPTLLDEPLFGSRVVGEHPEDLLKGDAFAECFTWGLTHVPSLQESNGVSR